VETTTWLLTSIIYESGDSDKVKEKLFEANDKVTA
jgi:hypothetical protein